MVVEPHTHAPTHAHTHTHTHTRTHACTRGQKQVQLDAQRRALEQLQGNVRLLESKLGEARNKRETLKARAASAKSSKQIQEVRSFEACLRGLGGVLGRRGVLVRRKGADTRRCSPTAPAALGGRGTPHTPALLVAFVHAGCAPRLCFPSVCAHVCLLTSTCTLVHTHHHRANARCCTTDGRGPAHQQQHRVGGL
jgi:hypothetical protein